MLSIYLWVGFFMFTIWQILFGLFDEKTNVLPFFGTISTALPNDVV